MAWLPRISQKLQKQNELPIVDLRNQDMRTSFCKKGRNGVTHMLWLENPRLEHNFGEKFKSSLVVVFKNQNLKFVLWVKNAGATYQWMMTRMFQDKIRCTVEVYIDDMVVKSKRKVRHIEDLQGCLRCSDNISYTLMLRNTLLG